MHELGWIRKSGVSRRRVDVLAHRHTSNGSNLLGQFSSRQDPSVSRFCSLGEFDLNHLDFLKGGFFLEHIRIELAFIGSATEISCAHLPDQVTTLKMIGADGSLAGVVGEISHLRSLIECNHGVLAESPVAHGRDVQQTSIIRLFAVFSSNQDANFLQIQMLWAQRMIDPLVTCCINIPHGSKRDRISDVLCPFVNHTPFLTVEGCSTGIGFDEILTNFRTDQF